MPNLVATVIRGNLGNPTRNTKSIRFRTAGLASIALLAVSSFCTATTSAMATEASTVPARMHLTDVMKNSASWLSKASLIPIDFAPNIGDLVTEQAAIAAPQVLSQNAGESGSICFVVRRPGWVLCREHGQQLTELAASESGVLSKFGMFGVVKETGVDDEGLRAFQKNHYPYPLYRDDNLDFYRAFGDKKITANFSFWSLLNPFKIYGSMKEIGKRLKAKNLEGNLKGEGLKTGGIIVFGSDGEPKYAYPEVTGSPLETDDIVAALKDVSGASRKDEL